VGAVSRRLGAALGYAARGIPVFPCFGPVCDRGDEFVISPCSCNDQGCARPGKHPLTRRGFHEATVDPQRIVRWWERWPQANIGIPTGTAFDVLDVDGRQGSANLLDFARGRGLALGGPAVATGRGYHLLYAPTGAGCRVGLAPGLDWRGHGGYVIAPPSRHHSGAVYTWLRALDAVPLAEVPQGLRELLEPPAPQRATSITPEQAPTSGLSGGGSRGQRYGHAALAGEVAKVREAVRGDRGGNGRNDTLHRAAFRCYQLADAGLIDAEQVTAELTAAGVQIGLGESEVRRSLRSARDGAARNPRTALPRTPGRETGVRRGGGERG